MNRNDWPYFSLIAIAILFNLIFLFPEVSIAVPNLNDNVLHYSLIEKASEGIKTGDNILDPWVSYWDMGFPVFQYYQHLPHFVVAALYRLAGGSIDLFSLFNWVKYLLLSFFPLSIYIASRKLELPKTTAAFAALCSSLLSTNGLYGVDFASFVWRGSGLYPQIWGIVLLPLALGQIYSSVKYNKGYFKSTVLFTVLLLSHVIYAYMAFLSLLLFILLRIGSVRITQKVGRLALIFVLSGVASSYFLVPFFLNRAYLNRSVWELQEKYDSYGHKVVLERLFNGDLLDYGRLPILTLLMFLGLARVVTKRDESNRLTLALFLMWLLLYFGRPTWGVLLKVLPMSSDLHLHRFIGGVHLASIVLIGIGLHVFWDTLVILGKRIAVKSAKASAAVTNSERGQTLPYKLIYSTLGCVLIAAILIPVWRERVTYLNDNKLMMEGTYKAFKEQDKNIRDLVDYLRAVQHDAPGRVFVGLPTTWGKNFNIGYVHMYAVLSVEKLDALSYLYHAMSLNADIQVRFDETDPVHYNLFNVRYVVAPRERSFPEFVRPVRTFGNWTAYKIDTSGYFDLVQSDIAFYGGKESWYRANFQWLTSGLPKVKQHPSIFPEKDGGPYREWLDMGSSFSLPNAGDLPQGGDGKIISESANDQVYSASVTSPTPSYLIFKMTYHPYWRVQVDNVARETVMLSPSFIGVHLEPGEHQVTFRYSPPPYKPVLLILGLITLVVLLVFEKRLIAVFAPLLEGKPTKRHR